MSLVAKKYAFWYGRRPFWTHSGPFREHFNFLTEPVKIRRKEIDGILTDGVLVSHTEGRIIEARVSHRKSS